MLDAIFFFCGVHDNKVLVWQVLRVEHATAIDGGAVHSYALLPIGYPMGRFGPVRRVPLADIVYEDR